MKILNREDLKIITEKLRSEGKKIGFTSGTFDILHAGHVEYLNDAKRQCAILIVGVNSDQSVREYKNPLRPFNNEHDRAQVISSLEAVDYAFIFPEKNNNKNVEILKPDLYFKGGDYSNKTMSSAGYVKSYGGAVVLIPFKEGFSTTGLIERIQSKTLYSQVQQISYEPAPAVFLDRDGTIIEEVVYLHKKEQVKFIDGVFDALKKLKAAGFRLVFVTNQPGIGMGYFTKEEFFSVNSEILKSISAHDILIDKIYFCPHSKSDNCICRKPATGMIDRAKEELNIKIDQSYVIGDMTSDIKFGKAAGCKTILVKTGKAGADKLYCEVPDHVSESMVEAVDWILKKNSSKDE